MKYVWPKTPKHQLHAPTNISTAPSPTSLSSTGTRMAKDMTGDPTWSATPQRRLTVSS